MKRIQAFAFVIVGIVAGFCCAGPRDALWTQVQDAIDHRLPGTAITVLDEIIPGALEDQAYAEATKAICLQIALEGEIERDYVPMIDRLEAEIAKAPDAMKPVMEAVLAYWYWEYFKENRYRFISRTQTAEPSGADISTWDLPRILSEIDSHFTAALSAAEELQAVPVSEWNDLLEFGTQPDSYRPTLYDFLVYEALSFYTAGEQVGSLPQDMFEIMVDGPIFAPASEFLQWDPQTTDTDSAKLKAIRLYQDLLTFHHDDVNKSAFIDADLHRLTFGYNHALGPDKAASYQDALEDFVNQWADHEISARALYEYARVAYAEKDYVLAHTRAEQGRAAHPASLGGRLCYNLIQQIEQKSASVRTERVWTDPLPEIYVTYRNVTRVYFRVVPVMFTNLVDYSWSNAFYPTRIEDKALATDPLLQWDEELPATDDYQERTEALPAPEGLDDGLYVLIASHDPSFQTLNNKVSATVIWVSDLAMVIRPVRKGGQLEGFVLNGKTGAPIVGATVTRWIYRIDEKRYRPANHVQTDANGLFRFTHADTTYFYLVAEHGDRMLATSSGYSTRAASGPGNPQERTIFFTDRSLYRPGQTIHYKGICIHTDPAVDNYQTLAGRDVTVVFRDVNGQEIARQHRQCNDYGSFSGSFIAPDDRLLGRMSLLVASGPSGSTTVNVEEYKRPTFRVEIEPPTEAPKLGTEVVVPARATAYTGAAVGGAQVTWQVIRQVRFPYWCWWARWYPAYGKGYIVAYGTAVTEPDGSFSIPFNAKPDLSIAEEDEPVFAFQVHADVTDTAGETRSDTNTISVGYTALQATVTAGSWQTPDVPVKLTIQTQSLDGEPEPASGTIQVYTLQQPETVVRPKLVTSEQEPDASDPDTWGLGDLVDEASFTTNAQGRTTIHVPLEAGIYRVMLRTSDRFGKPVAGQRTIEVVDPQATRFTVPVANHLTAAQWSVEPGEWFMALWGTGYDTGQAFVEIECRGETLRSWWTEADRTQEAITEMVTEDMRGGFTLRVTYVRENRAYLSEQAVDVPWTNKQLSIRWETFRSLLEPGQEELWTVEITGPNARAAIAEVVAAAYDASLDQFLPHDWIHSFSGFRHETGRLSYSSFENGAVSLRTLLSDWGTHQIDTSSSYRHFPPEIQAPLFNSYGGGVVAARGGGGSSEEDTDDNKTDNDGSATLLEETDSGDDLNWVETRTNLDETAFFYPHLVSDEDGLVRMEFTAPETLTEWRFMAFAHDRLLRSGFLTDTAVTSKELMVQPNPPRFVREGDVIEFTVKVSNQSPARQTGTVRLTMADARTNEPVDEFLGNLSPDQTFDIPSMESRTYSWRLSIPDGCDWLTYKTVGGTTRFSDGQEGFLPVLSRQILVTESLPLPIRGAQTKTFEFTKLLESGQSSTLRHQNLTVQMVSQPAWYAVMALPYLMEYPYECSDQIFTRLYANALGNYIANSDPKIRRVFDQWKATPTLDSPLEQNEDLKSVALEETPWIRQAVAESEARKNVGILFDQNRLNDEISRALFKLRQMQLSNGLWPWLPGFPASPYITLYITTGFGRLRHLGLRDLDVSCAVGALDALDQWMDGRYRTILENSANVNGNHLSPTVALYLYGRSFFLDDRPVNSQYQDALDYWLGQARTYWVSQGRQSQAHLAIGLKRFGDTDTAEAIMASIREYSLTDEELGMYWQDPDHSWWWHRAPIETQAMMIEAFDEVTGDAEAVEDCRLWLLKQKQTQAWKTTKATADAIYALLLRGTDLLSSDALVEVALGGQWIEPEHVEAGTGFYETRFIRQEIQPDMGHITVKKTDGGVSWGSVHWQYLEDVGKVTPYDGTPLQLTKEIFVKKTTGQGPMLYPVNGPVNVGDELVVRIELRVDRDMEYVHMKDQRGSGTEPVNVLSRYSYQDGLGYYESTRDTATHFFMDYLREGVYVFEYSTRIQLRGTYQTGIASIQCMYAPEFNSHSESFELEVE